MASTPYSFQIDGKNYELSRELSGGDVMDIAEEGNAAIVKLLRSKADADTLAAIRGTSASEFNRILKGWFQGASLGE